MIVIYHDIGGTHSSATAANIHVNRLSEERVPDKQTLLSLPTFDRITRNDWGRLIYIGDDEFGAKVYTLCRQYASSIVIPAITDIYNIINNTTGNEGLFLVNTSPAVNSWMAIGGFMSRRLNMVAIGRHIVTMGTIKAYMNIVNIVRTVKSEIRSYIEKNEAGK